MKDAPFCSCVETSVFLFCQKSHGGWNQKRIYLYIITCFAIKIKCGNMQNAPCSDIFCMIDIAFPVMYNKAKGKEVILE